MLAQARSELARIRALYERGGVALLAKSVELEVGWLAWSWGAVKNSDCKDDGPFDMTTNGTFDGLTGWGREVASTDPNSIKNTSVRPRSIETGSCQ